MIFSYIYQDRYWAQSILLSKNNRRGKRESKKKGHLEYESDGRGSDTGG